jgi:hypothetical protein
MRNFRICVLRRNVWLRSTLVSVRTVRGALGNMWDISIAHMCVLALFSQLPSYRY